MKAAGSLTKTVSPGNRETASLASLYLTFKTKVYKRLCGFMEDCMSDSLLARCNDVYACWRPQGQQRGLNLLLLFLRDLYSFFPLPQMWSLHDGKLHWKIIYCSWFRFCDSAAKLSSSPWFHLRYDYCPRCQWWWRQQGEVLYYSLMPDNHNTFPIFTT